MTKRLMRLEEISPKMDNLSSASNGNAENAAEDKEEEMKSRKDKSITEEMEALGDLEAYATSVAYSTDMKVNPLL